jgi:photosystem II stability/assembly factor-like uncharacterized protein
MTNSRRNFLFALVLCCLGSLHASLNAQAQPVPFPAYSALTNLQSGGNGIWVAESAFGLFRSADDGISWKPVLDNNGSGSTALGYDGAVFYHISSRKMETSADQGQTWDSIAPAAGPGIYPIQMAFTASRVLFSTQDKVFRYDKANPAGPQLVFQSTGAPVNALRMRQSGNDLLLTVNDSLLRSTDEGDSWALLHTGSNTIRDFDVHDQVILMLTVAGMEQSTDNGQTWQNLNAPFQGTYLTWVQDTWIAVATDGSLRHSQDDGITWDLFPPVLKNTYGYQISAKKNQTILLSSNLGLLRSDDDGLTWLIRNGGFTGSYLGVQGTYMYKLGNYLVYNNHFSADDGQTWAAPVNYSGSQLKEDAHIVTFNGSYYVLDAQQVLHRSNGDLLHWDSVSQVVFNNYYNNLISTGDHFYRQSNGNMYESVDNGVTWTPITQLSEYYNLVSHHDYIYLLSMTGGLFRTGNGGVSWEIMAAVGLELNQYDTYDNYINASSDSLLLAYGPGLLFASSDHGLTFHRINANILAGPDVGKFGGLSVASDGSVIAFASTGNYLYFSPDKGANWVTLSGNFHFDGVGSVAIAIHDGYVFISESGHLWRIPIAPIQINQIGGKVFLDSNNNGLQDPGEPAYQGGFVSGAHYNITACNPDGSYHLIAQGYQDTIRPILPHPWIHSNPPYYVITASDTARNFGLYYPAGITDVGIELTLHTIFKPGAQSLVYLDYSNRGTATANGTVRFTIGGLLQFQSAVPMPDQTNGDTLIWHFQNLPPGETVRIPINVFVSSGAPVGATTKDVFAIIGATQIDANYLDNSFQLVERVTDTFDPIDKRCSIDDHIPEYLIYLRAPMEYTVRFQNTGTAPVAQVRILDTLSTRFDLSTFQVIASSHPVKTQVIAGHILEFAFDNINLPTASSDEPGSYGYVKYGVAPKLYLQIGDSITNTAYVYFDLDARVQTNTTSVAVSPTLGTGSPGSAGVDGIKIYPVPATGAVWTEPGSENPGRLWIFNETGQLMQEQKTNAAVVRLDLTGLKAGVYLVHWREERTGRWKTGKLVKM